MLTSVLQTLAAGVWESQPWIHGLQVLAEGKTKVIAHDNAAFVARLANLREQLNAHVTDHGAVQAGIDRLDCVLAALAASSAALPVPTESTSRSLLPSPPSQAVANAPPVPPPPAPEAVARASQPAAEQPSRAAGKRTAKDTLAEPDAKQTKSTPSDAAP